MDSTALLIFNAACVAYAWAAVLNVSPKAIAARLWAHRPRKRVTA